MTEEQREIALLHEWIIYFRMTGKFFWRRSPSKKIKAGQEAGSDTYGYRQIKFRGKLYRSHRLAWALEYGYFPKEIDHRNQIKNDNRISNLRDATRRQNNRNKKTQRNNKSGCPNVSWHKGSGRWQICGHDEYGVFRHYGYRKNHVDACEVANRERERVNTVLGV